MGKVDSIEGFREVIGTDGKYVTDGVIVINSKTMAELKPRVNKCGTVFYRLYLDGKKVDRGAGTVTGHTIRNAAPLKDRTDEIIGMHESGMSNCEIADALGTWTSSISKLLIRNGIHIGKGKGYANEKRHEEAIERACARLPEGIELVSEEGMRGLLRCSACGHEFSRLLGEKECTYECPACREERLRPIREAREEAIAEKRAAREAARKAREEERYIATAWKRETRTCEECGKEFKVEDLPKRTGPNTIYCSVKCRKRACGRNNRHNRRAAMKGGNVSLNEVFIRDEGRCYICHEEVSWEDFEIRNGYFVVGPTYPTIDHVQALANGGRHDYSNVRLACHRCNTMKRDTPLSEFQVKIATSNA